MFEQQTEAAVRTVREALEVAFDWASCGDSFFTEDAQETPKEGLVALGVLVEAISRLEQDVTCLIAENTHYRRVFTDRGSFEKRTCGAIRSAVDAHGPVTRETAASAAKRIVGEMYAAFREAK